MIAFATLLVGSGLVINAADNVPRYDMKPTCRAAVAMMGNQGRTVESCMAGEERARKDLEKDWSNYPSAERTQCAAPMANNRSPSYVELLICLEMMGDSRKHRDEEQAASKSKSQLASLEPPWNCWGRCAGELERPADKVELTGKRWRRVDGGEY